MLRGGVKITLRGGGAQKMGGGGGLHFSPYFGGGVDEVGYFWGEVKIFSLGLGGGATFGFLKMLSRGGGALF